MHAKVNFAVAAVLVAATLSSCSRAATEEQSLDAAAFGQEVAEYIEAARAGGAGDGQLEILEHAQSQGRLTFEDALAAILADMECVIDGGGSVEYYEQTEDSGLVVPSFVFLADDDAGLDQIRPTVDACSTRESFWVNKLYQLQPTSQQVRDEYLASIAPATRECLEEHGYSTDASATPQDVAIQAIQAFVETDEAVDCRH